MLPWEFISHWLHRCFPAEEMLLEASWTWVRHQLSACSCIFLPSLLDNDDKYKNFHHHPRSQPPELPSQQALLSPPSPPKLPIENEELLEQPMCTFDSWYRLKKILSLDQNCSTAKMFVGNICRRRHHSQISASQPGCLQTCFSMGWGLLQPRPWRHDYSAVWVKENW